jgi:MtrB/PioB family decaheme-associated outer membrane protein
MRKTLILAAAGLVLGAVTAGAQQEASPRDMPRMTIGSADLTFRTSDVSGDAARFQRYRDMRDATVVERFRFDRQGGSWRFESSAQHVGRRDQEFFARFLTGKVKASFTWDQIPFFVSGDTRTPYVAEAPGVLRLDDATQQAIQAGQLGLADLARGARSFDLRSRRHVGAFAFVYSPTASLDIDVKFTQTRRNGEQAFSGGFGFSDAVELAAPVDSRTDDMKAGLEWAGGRGSARVGYDGSWYHNDVTTLVWDNPLKFTDAVSETGYRDGSGGAQGQTALWPDSTAHGATAAGLLELPARSRLTGSVRLGVLRQNQALLPATINTAAPPIALPRDTADVNARTLAMNYAFTSRPSRYLWLNARYRHYDFDNRTAEFDMPSWLVMDQTLHAAVSTEPISYTRRSIDLDASVTPVGFTALRVGYTRSMDDRTHRIFERTVENTYRASIDTVAAGMLTLRGIVERAERRGTGFEEELLVAAGEQPALRHYDVADRDRRRVTGLLQVAPVKFFAVSASASGFGLRDSDARTYSVTLDLTPIQRIAATGTYTHERYSTLQRSRNASPGQETEATRDWSLDSGDRVETIAAGLDVLKLLPRTDVRLSYDYTRSTAAYTYGVPANTVLAPLVQLPPVRNELRTAMGDLQVFVTRTVAIGAVYYYDDYVVDDFSQGTATIGSQALPGSLFLGSVYRPYKASTASLRLSLFW